MIKILLWITVGMILIHYGILQSIFNFFVTSDAIDLIIEFLEGLKISEEK